MGMRLPASYWILWLSALVNRLGGFVFTFLPLYLTARRGFTLAEAGGVVGLYGAGAVLSAFLGGIMADHLGRRRAMLTGTLLGAAAMLALGQAEARWAIVVGAFVLGVMNDLYRPAQNAVIVDVVAPSDRARAYGYLYWAVNLGFALAAVIAGLLAKVDYKWLFYGDAATTLLCAALIFVGVPETRTHAPQKNDGGWSVPWRDRDFVSYAFTHVLLIMVFMQCQTAFPLDLRQRGVGPDIYGRLAAVNGVLIVLLQPFALRRLRNVANGNLLAAGALLVGIGFGSLAFANSMPAYVIALCLWTLGEISFSIAQPVVIAELSPSSLRGRYQGAAQMIWAAAFCLGPVVGTATLEHLGRVALWLGCAAVAGLSAIGHALIAPARARRLANESSAESPA